MKLVGFPFLILNEPSVAPSSQRLRFAMRRPIRLAQHVKVDGTTTLNDVLTIDGGTFSTGSLVNPQRLDFIRGTFNLSGDDLTIGFGGLFGDRLGRHHCLR